MINPTISNCGSLYQSITHLANVTTRPTPPKMARIKLVMSTPPAFAGSDKLTYSPAANPIPNTIDNKIICDFVSTRAYEANDQVKYPPKCNNRLEHP
ncbi:MAG: hypothetical protein ACJ70U_08090 [Nitrososphaera sp.]